jgi:hypothetical protein
VGKYKLPFKDDFKQRDEEDDLSEITWEQAKKSGLYLNEEFVCYIKAGDILNVKVVDDE